MKWLQAVENAVARFVSAGARRREHIIPILRSLQQLLVLQTIYLQHCWCPCVKVCLCVRVHGVPSVHINELCVPINNVPGRTRATLNIRPLRSTACVQLLKVQTLTGPRSFAFHRPTGWNSLPSRGVREWVFQSNSLPFPCTNSRCPVPVAVHIHSQFPFPSTLQIEFSFPPVKIPASHRPNS